MKPTTLKMFAALTIIGTLVFASICASPGQGNKQPGSSAAEKAILARLTDIQNAAQALDADKVFSFVVENKSGAVAQNGRLLLTRQDALESTRRGLQALQKIEYHFDQQHVTLLSPATALAVGEGVSTAVTQDGRTITTRFAQSVVLVLSNGEWKVFHSHRSFVPQG